MGAAQLPDGVEEPLLEPGHVMYLPTGTPHAARAQDTVSLHITIGINQLTWRGLVERSLSSLAAEVPPTTCRPATSRTRRPWPTSWAGTSPTSPTGCTPSIRPT